MECNDRRKCNGDRTGDGRAARGATGGGDARDQVRLSHARGGGRNSAVGRKLDLVGWLRLAGPAADVITHQVRADGGGCTLSCGRNVARILPALESSSPRLLTS